MEMSPYVERLREALDSAAAGAGADVQDAADRLNRALDAAVRLTLFEVLADAAAEITSSLPSGSVTARLSGRGVDFVVEGVARGETLPLVSDGSLSTQPPGSGGSIQDAALDEGDLARITVRLPEGIKDRAEEQAGRLGQSLNSWIVKTLRQATGPTRIQLDLSGDRSFADQDFPHGGSRGRLSGWI